MEIKSFVAEINGSMPTLDMVLSKFRKIDKSFSDESGKRVIQENTLEYFDDKQWPDEFEELMYATNISKIGIGAIVFRKSVLIMEGQYKWFASYNDFEKICLDAVSGNVFIVDESLDNFETIFKTFSQFLIFMIEYAKDNNFLIYGREQSSEKSKIMQLIADGASTYWIRNLMSPGYLETAFGK